MRKLPLGVAISMIVHAGAFAYVALFVLPGAQHDAPDARPPVEIEVVPVAPHVEPAPTEVVLLDEPAVPAPPPVQQPAQPTHAPAAAALATSPHAGSAAELPSAPTSPTGATAGSASPETPSPHRSLLAMRQVEAPRIVVPAGAFDAIAKVPRGTPEVEIHSGELHDNGAAGTKSDQGPFTAKVGTDGTAKLDDKANIGGVGLAIKKDQLKGYLATDDKTRFGQEAGDPAIAPKYQSSPGTVGIGGNGADDHAGGVMPIAGGHFDATDALMRRHGMDPYFERKLKFLDSTRDERAQIGDRSRKIQLAHASQLMQKNLAALWAAPGNIADKKLALFELWDDCADAGDASLVTAADDARRMVIGFIRGHLPAGSANAYTPAELAELARHQQSTAAFQPYPP